jgi:outer membrane protein TolC
MAKQQMLGILLAGALLLQPFAAVAQEGASARPGPITMPDFSKGYGYFPNPFRPYVPASVPQAALNNTPRVDQLFREGKLHLSLADAIALAIENNLDVAVQRYSPLLADTDILRTQAGGAPRGSRGNMSGPTPIYVSQGSTGGTTTAAFDPVLTSTIQNQHLAIPVTSFVNRVVQGLTSVKANTFQANFAYVQGFQTGTQLNVNLNNARQTSVQNTLNPQISSNFNVTVTQKLLNGFGFAPNNRGIRVARNNREVSDLVFKQQITTTVNQVQNQYWDLVSATEAVNVAQRSLQVSEKLYNDNKRQVEIGTLAPIEVVRAEAEVAARRQDLIVAESNLQQLSTSMINLILRNISDGAVLSAQVVPTDKITVPPVEPVTPVQELIGQALSSRPELAQARIDITNRDINLKSVKSTMMPTVDAFAYWAGRGVAGIDRNPATGQIVTTNLTGGLGRAYTNLWQSDFPDYGFGFQINIPLRNRSAQADVAAALLDRRMTDLRLRQMENVVRVEVTNAMIGMQQTRARIDAARKQRTLAEQSLDAEQKKFQLGASTNYLVIQAQRDLTSALSAEVQALGNYMKARVEMDRATGQTIFRNSISLEEAYAGQLTKLPVAVPVSRQDN